MPQPLNSLRLMTVRGGRLIGACWLLTTSLGHAQTSSVDARLSLEWSAPSECPTSEQVRADLRSLLVHSRGASSESIAVTATIHRSERRGYELVLISNANARKIQSDSCAQLAEAAALMMALMLDPGLALEQKPPVNASEPAESSVRPEPVQPVKTKIAAAPPTAVSRESSAPNLVGTLEAAARLDIGAWPSALYGAVLGAGLGIGNWRLSSRVGLGSRVRLSAGQGARLEFVPVTIGVESGYRFRFGAWGLEPRLGAELGVSRSRTFELSTDRRTALSVATTAMARINRQFGVAVQGWLGVGTAIPVLRPRWTLGGVEVHELGIALRTEAGVQVSF